MEVFKVLFISILSIIFTVQWITAQEFNEGYNLHKGPVFYEAYYYPEKQNLHKRRSVPESEVETLPETVPERSFQSSKNPNVIISIGGNEITIIGDKLTRIPFRSGASNINQEFMKSRRQDPHEETIFDDENDMSERFNKLIVTSRLQRNANPSYHKSSASNFVHSFPNNSPRSVKFNEDLISSKVQSDKLKNYNSRDGYLGYDSRRNHNLELRDFPDSFQEDIFEPRPQIIKYLFSAPRENKSKEKKSNFISVDTKVDSVIKEPGIASIEVSEEPRHKIRHHHGERLKRNYSRQ